MSWFALFDPDDRYEGAVASLDGYDVETRARAVAVPRPPEQYERWDKEAGEWVVDKELAANHSAGPEHVRTMHILKTVEAQLILAGYGEAAVNLNAEAEQRGITPTDLARIVTEKSAPTLALELKRQVASLSSKGS